MLSDAAMGTAYLGPQRQIYTLSANRFAAYDRQIGAPICSVTLGGVSFAVGSAVGGLKGVFSSFRSTLTAYGMDCSVRNVFEDVGRTDLRVYSVSDSGWILASDYKVDSIFAPFDPFAARLIGVTVDGTASWQNSSIAPNTPGGASPIRARHGSIVYVSGFDTLDANRLKLFGVDEASGVILSSFDLSSICVSCGVAVDDDGVVYVNVSNVARIYRVR